MSSDADASRRQQEISLFAAMALGEEPDEPSLAGGEATSYNNNNNNSNASNDDPDNNFDFAAALASGGGVGAGAAAAGAAAGSFALTAVSSTDSGTTATSANSRDAFKRAVAAANDATSGTFDFKPTTSSSSSGTTSSKAHAPSSNLAAAVAALEAEGQNTRKKVPTGSTHTAAVPLPHKPAAPTDPRRSPMFTHQVSMPRPLFFGAILPPRVVQQGRAAVLEAYGSCHGASKDTDDKRDGGYIPGESNPTQRPRLAELPAPVRNLVGAIRTFGYHIDILGDETPVDAFLQNSDRHDTSPRPYWQGDGRVTTYQPLWGEAERMARIQKAAAARQSHRPSPVTHRSVTAPAAVLWASSPQLRTAPNDSTKPTTVSENEQFSQWLRGGDEDMVASPMAEGNSSMLFDASASSFSFRDEAAHLDPHHTEEATPKEMSERDIFSQWAQGGVAGHDSIVTDSTSIASSAAASSATPAFDNSTFQLRPPPVVVDSDEDSIDYDEERKHVGLNDHMSKALASLTSQSALDEPELETHVLLSQVPTDGSKRALTNYEVTGGCVPLFGVDDAPLPVESDLGIHETKEEQQRSLEIKRSQEIVEKFVAPNVFGSIACPNPALNPDDFHSWNTRASGNQRVPSQGTVESLSLPSFAPPSRPSLNDLGNRKDAKRFRSKTRYGWWNIGKEEDWPATVTKPAGDKGGQKTASEDGGKTPTSGGAKEESEEYLPPLRQLPPEYHSATALQVVTALGPTPGQLQKDNLPLSRMDAATSASQALPYLSDRPPSYRYLQIDTQAVAFPPSGGEIEPYYCTLAIYNVETVSSNTAGESTAAPVPDLQRCGRVTEALNFDVVRDPEIEKRCSAALWPCGPESAFAKIISGGTEPLNDRSIGTRCGVFPLPSNLSFSNLYAVLIVHKILSEESLDVYLKPGMTPIDLDKLRSSAERASQKHSPFLLPFAFGVAPLMQVFAGSENPVITSSRAVQIPLFRFSPGLGHTQIIDHIMVMLNPRADRRAAGAGGPAAPTNGGTAMLVMRSFGFLGLHQVVDGSSSLARDRLVDFTGELQLRRKENPSTEEEPVVYDGFVTKLPDWCPNYVAEPTSRGGRAPVSADSVNQHESPRYAQELAPRSLQPSRLARMAAPSPPSATRSRFEGGQDIEPFYFTSFCNEMLLHPRLLHNCPRGNIVVKAELRELEWNGSVSAYFAHLPEIGPALHNNRRGPFLVQSLFTSCSPRGSNKHFMDEFKLKLPLLLQPRQYQGTGRRVFALLFTVYNIRLSSKSKWKKLFSSSSSEAKDDSDSDFRMDQIACGFLPISNDTCLIDDGLHDVRIMYTSEPVPTEYIEQGKAGVSSLILRERTESSESTSLAAKEHSIAEDTTVSNDSGRIGEGLRADQSVVSASDIASMAEESLSKSDRQKITEPLSLSVRITCHSSVHAQNETLAEMLELESDLPSDGKLMDPVFLSKLRMGRDFLQSSIDSVSSRRPSSLEVKLFESAINIVKSQVCPITHSHVHVHRVFPILWRTLLCGTGEPDLAWANPAAPIPLRLHTFATILQLLGGISLYLQKNGVTQVDGLTKWNIVTLGRVVALLFDEGRLFGKQAMEAFDKEKWDAELKEPDELDRLLSPLSKKPTLESRRKRHVRQNLEILDMLMTSEDGADEIVEEPKSATPPSTDDATTPSTEAASTSVSTRTSRSSELKVDSKTDFQSALRVGNMANEDDSLETDGAKRASAMIQAYGSASGNRRWMTAPVRALSTIKESEDIDDLEDITGEESSEDLAPLASIADRYMKDQVDSEILLGGTKKPVKQMRIPKRKKTQGEDQTSLERPKTISGEVRQISIPQTDQEIETAGSAFLDVIGKSLGMSAGARMRATEDQRVGSSNHRKTRSNSSIDWSLLGDGLVPAAFETSTGLMKDDSEVSQEEEDSEAMSALKQEENNSFKLPGFAERLMIAGKLSNKSARWFPFAYEVVILQWAAILMAQRAAGEKNRSDGANQSHQGQNPESEESANQSVSQAAARSIGVAVAGAPLLFEIIKHSLGFRIHSLYEEVLSEHRSCISPPLLVLEEPLHVALEQVVSMVADACIDSRNFDSKDLRQMSINVNDSIVRFLRDMFSMLSPSSNHRLVLAYLSRFVTREGKHWQDRDSSIGLRCSWEITKLRLNAITGLVRFPDFVRINSPQMLNWSKWWVPSSSRPDSFFSGILQRYRNYRLAKFVGDNNTQSEDISFPQIQPHWLAEVVVDICLLGTEHVEPQIQQRSAALLHEMFWSSSQDSILTGKTGPVAGMYLTFLEKMLSQVNFLSNFSPKSQLRKDLLPCVVFVLQSAPSQLLRALWRGLCAELPGKSRLAEYGGHEPREGSDNDAFTGFLRGSESRSDVLDMFKLLNLSLKTMEYEGSDENAEGEHGTHSESTEAWRREFLLGIDSAFKKDSKGRRRQGQNPGDESPKEWYSSSLSRKWHAHDGSLVILNAGHQLVFEFYSVLHTIPNGQAFLNPSVRNKNQGKISDVASMNMSRLIRDDVVLFVRAATSLYLHALALRESDIAIIRAFKITAEVIKIFGIKTFLEAVGETLQHWMRVISLHCGARRANVRIEATDLLELMLRSTWECYGSFFRIRVPLLAVQTEVMERIVATAATRYYRDQRRLSKSLESFTNVSAEASLVPLWRTLDRIEKQPASQNVAFRGALVRMSSKLKKLYRAYVAARVLSFIQGARSSFSQDDEDQPRDNENEALIRANRISVLRVINASEGHSKQFLGFHATTQQRSRVAHFEAVEDALIDAADVFSPTELPEHRVAWLRMLADFHSSRKRYAEEATCHFLIHVTLRQAAQLHGSLWSNTPFLPWTDNMPDPVYIDGDGPAADPDYMSEYGMEESDGQYATLNSFRRIFYRVANSVSLGQDDWGSTGRPNVFCGLASLSEYFTVSPWLTLKAMEEDMVEEAEAAGELFLSAGIIESSRCAWRLAAEYYSQRFNYAKLAIAYGNLSRTVVSKVPQIDSSVPQEVSAILGRFYRVWFHGGAPDELNGIEFVYRAEGNVRLDQFGEALREVIKSIIPDKTPIHLVLDGRSETKIEDSPQNFGFRLGPTPLEPVRIKVTPLRPLFGQNRSGSVRGMPEWFARYADEAFSELHHRRTTDLNQRGTRSGAGNGHRSDISDPHHQGHARSMSASVFSSNAGTGTPSGRSGLGDERASRLNVIDASELSGVDKFCFVQPKDRSRSKDWWKYGSGDFAQKSLKVTQLQVAQDFPACVARQPVVHRLVYSQSPLEAGIDAVCQWCAVLFRTAVATIGMAVLGSNSDPGIGTDAVKVVVDCIHSSQVKEIGLSLMTKLSDVQERSGMSEFSLDNYDRLSDGEVEKLQLKLARLIVVFFELLHLLITRNRQILLDVMQERKKTDHNMLANTSNKNKSKTKASDSPHTRGKRATGARSTGSFDLSAGGSLQAHHSLGGYFGRKGPTDARSTISASRLSAMDEVRSDDGMKQSLHSHSHHSRHLSAGHDDQQSVQSLTANNPSNERRTGSAIAVQGELQRGFILMAKALYPKVYGIMQSDTPRWFKQCAQDSYFSMGTYKQTKVPIAEEIGFTPESTVPSAHSNNEILSQGGNLYDRGLDSPRGSVAGSSHHSVVSRGSERYGFGAF